MRRPTYDIEYLSDHSVDYGTSVSMSTAIENVIDYIEYLEAKVVKINPFDVCSKCGGKNIDWV